MIDSARKTRNTRNGRTLFERNFRIKPARNSRTFRRNWYASARKEKSNRNETNKRQKRQEKRQKRQEKRQK